MRALILAAGLGTRLKPFTDLHPKALFPIGGKTLLEWQVESLHRVGITDITVNVHHMADQLTDFIAQRWPEIRISDERDMLLETGGAIRKVGGTEPLLVLNVDILSDIDLASFVASYTPDCFATVVVSSRTTQRYFCFSRDRMVGWTNVKTGEVKGLPITPNPSPLTANPSPLTQNPEPPTLLAFSGMHILSPRALQRMQAYPERFCVTDFYIDCCSTEVIRSYVPSSYHMMDIGKTECLAQAEAFVQDYIIK